MTEVIKFNIGGQRYEVSRSLLDKHPDSMLARISAQQWQEDPEAVCDRVVSKMIRGRN